MHGGAAAYKKVLEEKQSRRQAEAASCNCITRRALQDMSNQATHECNIHAAAPGFVACGDEWNPPMQHHGEFSGLGYVGVYFSLVKIQRNAPFFTNVIFFSYCCSANCVGNKEKRRQKVEKVKELNLVPVRSIVRFSNRFHLASLVSMRVLQSSNNHWKAIVAGQTRTMEQNTPRATRPCYTIGGRGRRRWLKVMQRNFEKTTK